MTTSCVSSQLSLKQGGNTSEETRVTNNQIFKEVHALPWELLNGLYIILFAYHLHQAHNKWQFPDSSGFYLMQACWMGLLQDSEGLGDLQVTAGQKELVGLLSWLGRTQHLWSSHNGLQMEGTLKTESHTVKLRKPLWMLFQCTREDLLQECVWVGYTTFTGWVGKLKGHSQQEVGSKESVEPS